VAQTLGIQIETMGKRQNDLGYKCLLQNGGKIKTGKTEEDEQRDYTKSPEEIIRDNDTIAVVSKTCPIFLHSCSSFL
jgi:hypothetical protein